MDEVRRLEFKPANVCSIRENLSTILAIGLIGNVNLQRVINQNGFPGAFGRLVPRPCRACEHVLRLEYGRLALTLANESHHNS